MQILKLNPYLFGLMDLIFPYKHFSNTILHNITYLIDLFTKLYLAKINFKVIVDNNEFLFQLSTNATKMICYFYINQKFLIDINSNLERILTKGEKPSILFKIIPQLIKDPSKDYIAYNNYMYTTILNIIQNKKENTINKEEVLLQISKCQKNNLNLTLELDKNKESFFISRFININNESSLFGICWGLLLNFNDSFLKYIKVFCSTIERKLINLAYILNKIIEPKYIESIFNICQLMKEFSNPSSVLWQINADQFTPEPSKAYLYNKSIKIEKQIIDKVFKQEIKFNENIKADFLSCLEKAQKKLDKLTLINIKDEKERKIKEKLYETKEKLYEAKTDDCITLIVKNKLLEYICQSSEKTSLLNQEIINDITEKVNIFIGLLNKKKLVKRKIL